MPRLTDDTILIRAEVYDSEAEAWIRFVIEDPIPDYVTTAKDLATRVRYWAGQRAVIAGGWEVRDIHAAKRVVSYERLTGPDGEHDPTLP
jgi:hypothetical protein